VNVLVIGACISLVLFIAGTVLLIALEEQPVERLRSEREANREAKAIDKGRKLYEQAALDRRD